MKYTSAQRRLFESMENYIPYVHKIMRKKGSAKGLGFPVSLARVIIDDGSYTELSEPELELALDLLASKFNEDSAELLSTIRRQEMANDTPPREKPGYSSHGELEKDRDEWLRDYHALLTGTPKSTYTKSRPTANEFDPYEDDIPSVLDQLPTSEQMEWLEKRGANMSLISTRKEAEDLIRRMRKSDVPGWQ